MARRSPDRMTEAERYRAAAEATLNQLGWTIDYLYKIGKVGIARALRRNRDEIRSRMS